MRIIVCGSRTWTDRDTIYGSLDIIAAAAKAARETLTVVHGACPQGGDQIADDWIRERAQSGWPVVPERHPAKWKVYGRKAGVMRNKQMCLPGADCCLAFIAECVDPTCKRPKPHGSHGATQCADFAEYTCDIPTTRVERFTVAVVPMPDGVPS